MQAGLTTRNQDRAEIANGASVAETGEGGRVQVRSSAVELDQVFGHGSRLGLPRRDENPGNQGSLPSESALSLRESSVRERTSSLR